MKLVRYDRNGAVRLGALDDDIVRGERAICGLERIGQLRNRVAAASGLRDTEAQIAAKIANI